MLMYVFIMAKNKESKLCYLFSGLAGPEMQMLQCL